MIPPRDEKDISGCAISGIMSESGTRFCGDLIMRSIANMHERGNGLGGGFAAYGIYPQHADRYAFHLALDHAVAQEATRAWIDRSCTIVQEERIPTCPVEAITSPPVLQRYFVDLRPDVVEKHPNETQEDIVVQIVMHINSQIDGAFVFSCGKNMGVFKGVGYPEDIGRFFRIEEYKAHIWLGHGRFPTNTPGWWGGAHPFALLGTSVVHNGEISSYGTNKRYLENFGYYCMLHTDSEVICYLFDLLVRKQGLPIEVAAKVLTPPFWFQIDREPEQEGRFLRALRVVYGGALLNGPFSVVIGHSGGMIALNDRTKLRPMTAARKDDMLYLASEEAGIREICHAPDHVWHAQGGVPIVGQLKGESIAQVAHTA